VCGWIWRWEGDEEVGDMARVRIEEAWDAASVGP
jgi:hypothetical protein